MLIKQEITVKNNTHPKWYDGDPGILYKCPSLDNVLIVLVTSSVVTTERHDNNKKYAK